MHTLARHLSGWGRRKPKGYFTQGAPFAAVYLFPGGAANTKEKDWSGNGNTLPPNLTVSYVPGPFAGMAFHSDGNAYFSTPDAPTLKPASFTLLGWLYPQTVGGINTNYIASKTNSSSAGWSLYVDSTGTNLKFDLNGGGASLSSAAPPTNAWHQIAATYNAGTKLAALYVDGVQKASASNITLSTSNRPLEIANSTSDPISPAPFPGHLDHFLFLPTPLPAQAIAELYREPFRLFQARPLRVPMPNAVAVAFPFARKPKIRRRPKLRRRRRAGRQLPRTPIGHCPTFRISESLAGTLRVLESMRATGLAAERLAASAEASARLSASALVAESLSASAKITC